MYPFIPFLVVASLLSMGGALLILWSAVQRLAWERSELQGRLKLEQIKTEKLIALLPWGTVQEARRQISVSA